MNKAARVRLTTAFFEGRQAGQEGKTEADCPYPESRARRLRWHWLLGVWDASWSPVTRRHAASPPRVGSPPTRP